VKAGDKIRGSGDSQAVLAYRVRVFFPDIVRPHFDLSSLGQVSGKQATDGSATHDANFHPKGSYPRFRRSFP
jgi:hypothetical protein